MALKEIEKIKVGQIAKITLKDDSEIIGRVENISIFVDDNDIITLIEIAEFDENIFDCQHFKGCVECHTSEIKTYEVLEQYHDVYMYNLLKNGKYFTADDRCFICDKFEGTFVNLDGEEIKGTISGASVLIAALYTDAKTNEPIYSNQEEDSLSYTYFDATIDSELGVLVVPNKKEIGDLQPESAYNIACKITGYTIEVETAPCYLESNPVSEAEFRRIVTENFEKFNNSNNYYGQSTSYASYEVKKKYSRKAYSVGFGEDGKPFYAEYGDNSIKFTEFVTSARTEEDAKKWCEVLSKYKNIEDFRKDWQEIQKANEDKMIEALKMAGKIPLNK